MADIFKLGGVRAAAGLKKSRYIEPRFEPEIQQHLVKYANAQELALRIGEPKAGSRVFAILDGKFIFGDFIEAFIVENEIEVEELFISTLSMSQENVDSLHNLIDGGYVNQLNMIVSDFFYSHERGGLIPYMYDLLDIDNRFQLAVASVHTKICLIKTKNRNKITIHGSANLRTSSNVEQIMIESNAELYDFNHEWHHSILERYATIKKSLRRSELWQAVLIAGGEPGVGSSPEERPMPREEEKKENLIRKNRF